MLSLYDADKLTSIPIILSLLTMSTKYDIPVVRCGIISLLQTGYPNEPSSMYVCYPFGKESPPKDYDFQILPVALQCNAKILFPRLHYDCAIHPLDDIFDAFDKLKNFDL